VSKTLRILSAASLYFLVENQQKISRHHEIKGVDGAIDLALVVDMQIDPRLDMIQIALILRSEINEVDTIQVKRFSVTPTFQRIGSWKTFDGRINYGLGPIGICRSRFNSGRDDWRRDY